MDKRKKYFCVVAVVLILLSGYGKISDSAFRMQMALAQELGLPAKNGANALARARRKLRGAPTT